MNEQTVTEQPDGVAQPTSEATGEQDMDALLADYDKKAAPAEPAAQTDDIKSLRAELQQDREERLREQNDTVFRTSTDTVVKSIDLPISDDLKREMAKGLILARAEDDPRIRQAFANQKADPKTWEAVLDNIAQSVNTGKLDKEATGSRKAMVNSMTGGTTETAPEDNGVALAKKIGDMNDAEFAQYKENYRG